MYLWALLDTTCFKAVMAMNLSELRSQVCFCESSTEMSDLLGSLDRRSQNRTMLCRWKWVVKTSIKVIAQLGGAFTSPWGSLAGTRWKAKNGGIPRGSPTRTLGPKRG